VLYRRVFVLREASRNWPLAELRPADVSSYQALIFRRLGEAPKRCKSLCPPNFSVATDLNGGLPGFETMASKPSTTTAPPPMTDVRDRVRNKIDTLV
jgi:hypothetical protein